MKRTTEKLKVREESLDMVVLSSFDNSILLMLSREI